MVKTRIVRDLEDYWQDAGLRGKFRPPGFIADVPTCLPLLFPLTKVKLCECGGGRGYQNTIMVKAPVTL
jgi:hypothetical protein